MLLNKVGELTRDFVQSFKFSPESSKLVFQCHLFALLIVGSSPLYVESHFKPLDKSLPQLTKILRYIIDCYLCEYTLSL